MPNLPCKICIEHYIENKVYFMCISQDMNDKVMCFTHLHTYICVCMCVSVKEMVWCWCRLNAMYKKNILEQNVRCSRHSTSTIYFILGKEAHLWQIAIWPTCLMIVRPIPFPLTELYFSCSCIFCSFIMEFIERKKQIFIQSNI